MTVANSLDNWARSRLYWLIAMAAIIAFFVLEIFPPEIAQWIFAIIGIIFAILFFVFYNRGSTGWLNRRRLLGNKRGTNTSNVAENAGTATGVIGAGIASAVIGGNNTIDNQLQNMEQHNHHHKHNDNSDGCPTYAKGGTDEVDDVLNGMN